MIKTKRLLSRKYWATYLVIALTVLIPLSAGGVYLFKSLSTHDGLTSSHINCILKDSRGYMWFGTPAGLYRYDGYTFRNFVCDSQDGSSLPDSYIKSIQETLDGELWIETASGFAIFHPQTESFDRDMNSILNKMGIEGNPQKIFVDSHKNLWMYVSGKGILCYNLTQQLLYEFEYTGDSHGIPEGDIASISECKEGALVVYSNGRILCLDVMHQQRTVWSTDFIAKQKSRNNNSLKAFADVHDNIWLYGPGTLMCYYKSLDKWDTTIGDKLEMTGANTDNCITGMANDKHGFIWISTDCLGLVRMNSITHETEIVNPTTMDHEQFNATNIQSIYVDNTGLLWIGTGKHGIAFYGENIYKFDSNFIGDVSAICQDYTGKTWFGTSDNGLIDYKGPLASRQVTSIATTRDGSLWVGSAQNGLTRIKNGKSIIYSTSADSMRTVIDDHINALTNDKAGNLWIATNGGLQVFNPTMETFSTYTKENGKLQSNDITSLCWAKGNNMLIGTSNGMIIMQLSTHDMAYYSGNSTNLKTFTNNYVTQVFSDSRGLIWIGTREGLNILNLGNDSLNYITEKEGLCNNAVCGITEDKNQNIWVTTNNGVCRIVVQRNRQDDSFSFNLYNYDTSDGLQSNEFNNGAILTNKEGQVLLGGLYGVNWIRNKENTNGEKLPRVMLTQLFIGEEEIFAGREYDGRVPLPVALNESNKITLSNKQNTFTIKFAAGDYNQCDKLQFIYWMEGLDEDWRNGDAMKHGVTFTDLPSGSYTLHVKAVSADGSISQQERTLDIVVRQPWWLSAWMITIYVIFIIVIIYVWKIGLKKIVNVWFKKKDIVATLKKQSDEIKKTSADLRQPMARMTSIITDMRNKVTTMEDKEDLNSLHFQMMQIIMRITQMRTMLENAEEKALAKANLDVDEEGNIKLPEAAHRELDHLTIEKKKEEIPTMRYLVVLIDDNKEFLNFMSEQLDRIYTFASYDNIIKATNDLEDLQADLVLCKQNMPEMTGSELCNKLKQNVNTERTKFVLITDCVMSPLDIKKLGITLAADDYIAKPFKLKEVVRRLNSLMGYTGDETFLSSIFENTKSLENKTSNGFTKEESELWHDDNDNSINENEEEYTTNVILDNIEDININSDISKEKYEKTREYTKNSRSETETINKKADNNPDTPSFEISEEETIAAQLAQEQLKNKKDISNRSVSSEKISATVSSESSISIDNGTEQKNEDLYSMLDVMDRQLMLNVEQYVMQNMSRGALSLEEMSIAMGMGRVPFFHKIKAITGKTPAELVRDLRLKHACDLLIHTPMAVSEIAIDLGFMTTSNFIHYFKDRYNMLPLEYQIKNKVNNDEKK
jgi:ligand-binding sensor domain-containing protein/AraC-like DNA-binding protein/DNA-binding response OmpR family regulator